ncbi:MAG TPA: PDZ domain-containing protein [Nitrospiraceae bacterium]|jgi:S1-C subfamily serine protease|nr:PDZ domain-containing protein [Nitrospiraceae bacterium]
MRSGANIVQTVRRLAAIAAIMALCVGVPESSAAPAAHENGKMTEDDAVRLGEEFGIIVGPVDEEIKQELKMQKAEGVVVFEVIGGTQAELAGIKVRAVIKEIDKVEVRNLKDFGRALKLAMPTCNFTVGTYEPADPETQGVGGVMNFHFVGCKRD